MVGVEGESSWTWTAGHNSFGDVASIAAATERHGASECGKGRAHSVRNGLEYLGATGLSTGPGDTRFTRMPAGASALATPLLYAASAALASA